MSNKISDRYHQAQSLMQGMLTNKIALNDAVFPHWVDESDNFWYLRDTNDGREFRLVDAAAASNTAAFDHQALATTLSAAAGQSADAEDLPITEVTLSLAPLHIHFTAFSKRWLFDSEKNSCVEIEALLQEQGLCSPDGKKVVFVRDCNLWIRDKTRGKEQALTVDGTVDNYYANAPYAGALQALWSPDSQYLFTHQLDLRDVATQHLIHHIPQDGSLRPQLTEYQKSYPHDREIERYRLVCIDINRGKVNAVDYPTLPFLCFGTGFFTDEKLAWWSTDSGRVFFIDKPGGANAIRVVELNPHTGSTRVLFEETAESSVRLSHSLMEELPIIHPLPETDELIWFSERSGWAHLYLYDLRTGQCKHAITGEGSSAKDDGRWVVRNLLHVDAKRREIILQTAGRDQNISPYYRDLCRINIDTAELLPLVTDNYDHAVYGPHDSPVVNRTGLGVDSGGVNGVSPSGQYIVTTYSRVNTIPVSILVDREGKEILTLETADVSRLPEGWHWPEPVKLKAADDQTDIYGVVYRPPNFDPKQSYPVLDFSCGHPGSTFVPQGSFINGPCFDAPYLTGAAYAALGFVVVALEGRGTPYRDKAFLDHSYGNMADAGDLRDRIAGIQQLATRDLSMDLKRVGIVGTDGMTAPVRGILEYPEFFKVGISICLSDARFGFAAITEQFEGVKRGKEGKAQGVYRYAEEWADSLSGKLLLIHGLLDNGVSTSATFRLADALQQANKDFDMVLLPTVGFDVPTYGIRRSWDYLVEHLLNTQAPKEFPLATGIDLLLAELSGEH